MIGIKIILYFKTLRDENSFYLKMQIDYLKKGVFAQQKKAIEVFFKKSFLSMYAGHINNQCTIPNTSQGD
jgi:hypothetical protein